MRAYPAKAKNSSPADSKMPDHPPVRIGPRCDAEAAPPNSAPTMAAASDARTMATMARVSTAVFRTPRRLTAVSATTAAMPSGRCHSGAA